jgi:hypothetical protein
MSPSVESTAPYKSRIKTGRSSELWFGTTTCPACLKQIRLLWPPGVDWIPAGAEFSLHCPACQLSFSASTVWLRWWTQGEERFPLTQKVENIYVP